MEFERSRPVKRNAMEKLSRMDLQALKEMHQKETRELHKQLINGALWHEVSELQKKVTNLSIAIHKKTQALSISESSSPDGKPATDGNP